MKYVYDELIDPQQTTFDYFGEEYELEHMIRKGNLKFYTFRLGKSEPIQVVPYFYEQYLEVLDIFKKFIDGKKPEMIAKTVKSKLDKKCEVMDFGEDISIMFRYKDIRAEIDVMNDVVGLKPEFVIVSGNVFGDKIRVNMETKKELFPYYVDRYPELY